MKPSSKNPTQTEMSTDPMITATMQLPDEHRTNHDTYSIDKAPTEDKKSTEDTAPTLEMATVTEPVTAAATEPVEPSSPVRHSINHSITSFPPEMRDLMHRIRGLNAAELLTVVEGVTREANKSVFSVSDYHTETWLLPHVEEVAPHKPQWGLKCNVARGLLVSITVRGIRVQVNIIGLLLRLALIFLVYFAVWTILPRDIIESGGVVFDPVVIVVMSYVVGGFGARLLQIPALIGVMWIAIMWNNVPYARRYTSGIVPEVRSICGRLGLTLILSRAGFALSLPALRQVLANSVALGLLPSAVEAVVHAAMAQHLFFDGDWQWAFIEALICSIISAAVVVPGVLLLREKGYGLSGGPLTLALTSVGIDNCAGIWAANFVIGLEFSDRSIEFSLGMIPVQIIGGSIIGIILGVLFRGVLELLRREAKRLPNGKYKVDHRATVDRLLIILFMTIVISGVFLGYRIGLPGGGAVLALTFAATVSHMLSKDGDLELLEHKTALGGFLSTIWDNIVMPLIFAMLGSNIVLTQVFNASFFPYGFAVVVTSTFTRFVVAVLCSVGVAMSFAQRVLLGLAWLGRAATQASLGGIPLSLARQRLRAAGENATDADFRAVSYGVIVQDVSVLYIIFCALIASLAILKLGPRVLERIDPSPRR